jgi:hypothetical protein
MKGVWLSSKDGKRSELADLMTPRVVQILKALREKPAGLSNAEIDSLLATASQWVMFWELRELMALDIIEFEVQPFGEPGKYKLTRSGASVANEL